MFKVSAHIPQTVVKFFVNTLTSISLVYSPHVFAQTNTSSGARSDRDVQLSETEACSRANTEISSITQRIGEACRKAGLGGPSNCVRKAKECANESGEESFDTLGSFASALGYPQIQSSNQQAALAKACPQMSGRDYFTEKEKVEANVKDLEKELLDLEKERAQVKKDYDKEMNEINEALAKAQEEYKKTEVELDEAEREKVAEFNRIQSETAQQMRSIGTEILGIEAKLISVQRNKAAELITYSQNSAKLACMKKVRDAKAESTSSINSASSGGYIAKSKQKKDSIIKLYTDCMDNLNQKRISINETAKADTLLLNKQLTDAKERQLEIQNSLNLAETQLKEMKEATVKQKANALQAVVDLGTRSQALMTSAYENMVANQAAINKRVASITAALNRANNSMLTLGPAPASSNTEYSPADAASDIETYMNQLEYVGRSVPSSCRTSVEGAVSDAKSGLGVR